MIDQSKIQNFRTECSEVLSEKKYQFTDLPQLNNDKLLSIKSNKNFSKHPMSLILDIKVDSSLTYSLRKKNSSMQNESRDNFFQKQIQHNSNKMKTNETLDENNEPSDIQGTLESHRDKNHSRFKISFYKHNPSSIEKAQQTILKKKQKLPKKLQSLIGIESKKTMLNATPAIGNYSPSYTSLYKHSPTAYLSLSKRSFQIIPKNFIGENKPTQVNNTKVQKYPSDDNNFEQQFQRLIKQIKNEVQSERLQNPNVYLHPNENLTIKQTMNADEARLQSQKMKLYLNNMRDSLNKIKVILNRD